MAFESLSERLNKAIKNISGQGKLTEKNMNEMLKEVRLSLLEADVNYNVVKEFAFNLLVTVYIAYSGFTAAVTISVPTVSIESI